MASIFQRATCAEPEERSRRRRLRRRATAMRRARDAAKSSRLEKTRPLPERSGKTRAKDASSLILRNLSETYRPRHEDRYPRNQPTCDGGPGNETAHEVEKRLRGNERVLSDQRRIHQ